MRATETALEGPLPGDGDTTSAPNTYGGSLGPSCASHGSSRIHGGFALRTVEDTDRPDRVFAWAMAAAAGKLSAPSLAELAGCSRAYCEGWVALGRGRTAVAPRRAPSVAELQAVRDELLVRRSAIDEALQALRDVL